MSIRYVRFFSHVYCPFLIADILNECNSGPCHNGGTCIDHLGKFECECTNDYSGQRCELGNNIRIIRIGGCMYEDLVVDPQYIINVNVNLIAMPISIHCHTQFLCYCHSVNANDRIHRCNCHCLRDVAKSWLLANFTG